MCYASRKRHDIEKFSSYRNLRIDYKNIGKEKTEKTGELNYYLNKKNKKMYKPEPHKNNLKSSIRQDWIYHM